MPNMHGIILINIATYVFGQGRGVLAKNHIFEVYTAPDHVLPQIISVDPLLAVCGMP